MRSKIHRAITAMCVLGLLLTAGASDADRLPLGAAAALGAFFTSSFAAIAHLTLKNRPTGANSEAADRITA